MAASGKKAARKAPAKAPAAAPAKKVARRAAPAAAPVEAPTEEMAAPLALEEPADQMATVLAESAEPPGEHWDGGEGMGRPTRRSPRGGKLTKQQLGQDIGKRRTRDKDGAAAKRLHHHTQEATMLAEVRRLKQEHTDKLCH